MALGVYGLQAPPQERTTRSTGPADAAGAPRAELILVVEVHSQPGGAPLPGASAWLTGAHEGNRVEVSRGRTGGGGRTSLHHRRERALILEVRAAGHVGHSIEVPGHTTRLAVALEAFGALEGEVVDRDGARIQAALSLALPPRVKGAIAQLLPAEMPGATPLGARTDRDGLFRFERLPPGDNYYLRARSSDFGTGEKTVSIAPGETTRVSIVLYKAGALKGRVLDLMGVPVFDAEVRLFRSKGPGWHQSEGVRTGRDGRFHFEGVRPGNRLLQVERTLGGRHLFIQRRPRVLADRTIDLGDLRPVDRTLVVRPVVDGKRAQGASKFVRLSAVVMCDVRKTGFPVVSTVMEGEFGRPIVIVGLLEGELELTLVTADLALRGDVVKLTLDAAMKRREVEIVARPRPHTVVLEVELPVTKTVRSLFLVSEGKIVGRFAEMPGDATPLVFRELPPGVSGELWVLESGRYGMFPFKTAGDLSRMKVDPSALKPAAILGGIVRDPPEMAWVLLSLPGGDGPFLQHIVMRRLGKEGRFRFDAPPDRDFEISILGQSGRPVVPVRSPAAGKSDETIVVDRR